MFERVIRLLPEYFREILDYVEMGSTEDIELNAVEAATEQLLNDEFVLTSSQQAVKRREDMLGIQADPTMESLEFRKQRILNRYQTKPPFTIRWLQQQLDRLVGPGMTIVSVDVQNFILTVTANIDNANVFREVQYTIQTIKPANMDYQQNTALEEKIGLRERLYKQEVGWNYKLNGTWQLGEKPFATLGPEVPIT